MLIKRTHRLTESTLELGLRRKGEIVVQNPNGFDVCDFILHMTDIHIIGSGLSAPHQLIPLTSSFLGKFPGLTFRAKCSYNCCET